MPEQFEATGAGGAEFTFDRPRPDSHVEERLVEQIVNGDITVHDGPPSREFDVVLAWLRDVDTVETFDSPAADDGVPEGTVPTVLDWVRGAPEGDDPTDGWQERAEAAIAAEYARDGRPRQGIIDPLTEALEAEEV